MAHQTLFQRFSDAIVEALFLWFIPIWIRPNVVTTVRLVLTPIVVVLLLKGYILTAITVFVIAAITDLVDGAMARTRDQITDLGKILDPIADKLLIGSLMVPLVAVALSPLLAFSIVVLEVCFLVGGVIRNRKGIVLQANWWGKIKFNFQVLGILLLLVNVYAPITQLRHGALIAFSFALGFGVVSLMTQGF